LSNGQIAWQTRLTDVPFLELDTSDDFVAARFSDDFGSVIVALETFTGQIIWRKAFTPENGQIPVNMTLSPDGTLLFTMPDRLCGIDLYEPAKNFKFGEKPSGDGSQMFAGGTRWDQLVVADGRVLAVADGGQSVRVLSPDKGTEVTTPLATKANTWNVGLRVVGPRVYIINQHAPLGYSLDHPEEIWEGLANTENPTVRDAFVGKQHLVLLDQPDTPAGAEPAAAAAHFRLLAYGRYPRSGGQPGESGRLDQTPDVTHAADIDQWQPVEGGFYYHSIDRQAHFLKGSAVSGG
jgi:outer membrane protein assembly factor BamB